MIPEDTATKKEEVSTKDVLKETRTQLATELFTKSNKMTQDYRNTLTRTGSSLLVGSMVYAYSKGLNDAIKLLLKENSDVQK